MRATFQFTADTTNDIFADAKVKELEGKMSDQKEENSNIFLKFMFDKNKNIESMYINSDLDKVKAWPTNKNEEESDPDNAVFPKISEPFQNLGSSILKRTTTFRRTVPYVMNRMPMMIGIRIENRIRKKLADKSTILDKDDKFETHSLPKKHVLELRSDLSQIGMLIDGVNQIPNLFLIGLTSSFDAFFGDLMRDVLLSRPEIISSSDRNISFKDLVELGSIESAREMIIEKDIDQALRGSQTDRMVWLENRTNTKIRENSPLWPKVIELYERRNLFTHTEGLVSSQYVNVCKQNGHETTHKIGDKLSVSQKYFDESVSLLLEFGVQVYQTVWRKLLPDKIEAAEQDMHAICYAMLMRREYGLAANLSTFAIKTFKKAHKESMRRMMIVNNSIAEKEQGNKDLALAILNREDWSAVGDNFKICIHAIRDEHEAVIKLLPLAVASGAINISDIREWPALMHVKKIPEFGAKFQEIFGQQIDSEISPSQTLTVPEETEEN